MNVLVFAAHGDDETSMGGTIKKLTSKGHNVHVVIGTTWVGKTEVDRSEEVKKSDKILGSTHQILNFRTWVKDDRRLVSCIDSIIKKYQPTTIFVNWYGDSHYEHKLLNQGVLVSCRRNNINLLTYQEPHTGGLTYQIFNPRYFVDISDYMEDKLNSIKAYSTQIKKYPFWIQATEGIAKWYGSMIQVKYAEGFAIIILSTKNHSSCLV